MSYEDIKINLAILARYGDLHEFTDALYNHPELLNKPLEDSYTALHLACWSGNLGVVKLLLEKDAFIACKSDFGETPIMLAAYNNFLEVILLLASKGADIDSKDNGNRSIIDHVNNLGVDAIKKLSKVVNRNLKYVPPKIEAEEAPTGAPKETMLDTIVPSRAASYVSSEYITIPKPVSVLDPQYLAPIKQQIDQDDSFKLSPFKEDGSQKSFAELLVEMKKSVKRRNVLINFPGLGGRKATKLRGNLSDLITKSKRESQSIVKQKSTTDQFTNEEAKLKYDTEIKSIKERMASNESLYQRRIDYLSTHDYFYEDTDKNGEDLKKYKSKLDDLRNKNCVIS